MRPPTFAAAGSLAGVALVLSAITSGCAPRRTDDGRVPAIDRRGSPSVFLDGAFDEWRTTPTWIDEPLGDAAGSPVDLGPVHAREDAAFWYLALTLGDSVSLQAMSGTVHLVVDLDDDERTGITRYDVIGADAVIELSNAERPQPGGYGAGFALRVYDGVASATDPSTTRRNPYAMDVAALPTWSGDRFEIRIARNLAPRLGDRVRAQLVFTDTSGVRDRTAVAAYAFRASRGAVQAPATAIPPAAPGAVRVAQWNVAEGRFRSPANHARLLAAVRPDVLMLDEVYEEVDDARLAAFFAEPALAALGEWRWVISEAGGRQKTVVAARDRAIRAEPSMRRVTYAVGALDSLRGVLPAPSHRMLDVEEAAQLSATGAWVSFGDAEALLVPLDLQSAGYRGSPQDALRVLQSATLVRHITAARADARTPLIVGGDFNPVGGYAPVHELQRGLDVNGAPLTLAAPPRLGEASVITWRNPDAALFGPGRLDLTLYSAGSLERTGGFVFASDDLAPSLQRVLGLAAETSDRTSDHLIVVNDFRVR